jgi:flagellar biosynthetic protein FliR
VSELVASLLPLASLAEGLVVPAMIVFTRISLLVFLLPGLGTRVVPVRMRVLAAGGLTFLLLPIAGAQGAAGTALVPVLAGEALTGFYLGFCFRVAVFALSIAGTVIAQALSLSQIFGAGISEDSSTTFSTLLTLAGGALFLTAGLHVEAFGLLAQSYEAFPVGADGLSAPFAETALRLSAEGFAFGLSLAVPFVLMNLAYNAVLGLCSRAMPQLMVTFVGMPAITLAGLGLLAVSVTAMLTIWLGRVADFAPVVP